MNRFTLLILEFTLLSASLCCQSAAQVSKITSTPGQSVTTAKLRFPQRWTESGEPDRTLDYVQQLEVRKIPNSSEFFFGALPDGDYDYSYELYKDIPKPQYSGNSFAVNFADKPQVRVATEGEWASGSRIVTKPRSIASNSNDYELGEMEYRGKKYQKVGKYWGGGLLSPAGKWLALFSYSGVRRPPDLFFGGGDVPIGDAFWEVHDTVTGEKIFAWQATHIKDPASLLHPVVWLEERYLVLPQDKEAQDFLVVTLPSFTPEPNPVTVQLPSRKDEHGKSIPAALRHEAWTPLVPLTKEQAARITAPSPTEFSEVRWSAQQSPRELLFAIKEETENRGVKREVPREARDRETDYNLRVFSTYYYAISLDNPTQTRFATKEEWERGRVVRSSRYQISLDEKMQTTGGERPAYRQFPKTGASWGSPKALSAGQWIAVFSYTRHPGASSTGKMFVDFFEGRPGNKFLSTELPYTGSANTLFSNALWIEGGYVILPLDTSFDSFVLWTLPAGIS